MIDHTGIGVSDVAKLATFYDALLGALGWKRVDEMQGESGLDGVAYGHDRPVFWIDRFHSHSQQTHTAFTARTRADVDAFYAAGLAAGGTDHGAPGLRPPPYPPGYYAAFVRDPDGNNMEAVCRG